MDFLDRYGWQLERARRRRGRRRAAGAALLVPVTAAVAVAVFALPSPDSDVERPAVTPSATPTGTWSPDVGRPHVGLDARIDRSPVSGDAAEVLAVLRRPQTARDRRLAEPRLKHAGGAADGVQVDAVRALSKDYALVPVTKSEGRSEQMLCIMGGGGGACGPAARIRERGISSLSGGPNGTHWVGVVPDGVARVRFTPDGGRPKDSVVRENFYEIRVPEHGPEGRTPPPKGWKGPTDKDGMIPGPGGPANGTIEWFDAAGKRINQFR
jgi:hypothetical protein